MSEQDPAFAIGEIDAALAAGAFLTGHGRGLGLLWFATSFQNIPVLKHLFSAGLTLTAEWPSYSIRDPDVDLLHGETPLHLAAGDGSSEVLRLLLAQPDAPRLLHTFGELSRSPLHCAVAEGQLDCVRILLDAGSDPNLNDEQNIGDTPLDTAVEEAGHPEIVQTLLAAGADPDIPTWMQITARERADEKARERPAIAALIQAVPKKARSRG